MHVSHYSAFILVPGCSVYTCLKLVSDLQLNFWIVESDVFPRIFRPVWPASSLCNDVCSYDVLVLRHMSVCRRASELLSLVFGEHSSFIWRFTVIIFANPHICRRLLRVSMSVCEAYFKNFIGRILFSTSLLDNSPEFFWRIRKTRKIFKERICFSRRNSLRWLGSNYFEESRKNRFRTREEYQNVRHVRKKAIIYNFDLVGDMPLQFLWKNVVITASICIVAT